MSNNDYIQKGRILGFEEEAAQEEEKRRIIAEKKRFPWFFYVPILLLLALMTAGVVWYMQQKKEQAENLSKLKGITTPQTDITTAQKPAQSEIPDDKDLQEAVLLYNQNYNKAAKSAFNDIIESSKPSEVKAFAFVYLGIISDEEGKYNLAIDYFNRAVKLQPDNFYAHYNMALALRHKGLFEEAILALEKAKKLRPDKVESDIATSNIQYEANELPLAQQTLEELTSDNKNPVALYNLGMVYKKQGKMAEAKATFMEALELAAAGEIAYKSASQLGIIHAIQGDYPNAKFYMKKAINLSPRSSKYYYNLALVEYKTGNLQESVKNLELALKTGADNIETFVYIAGLYSELGYHDKAESALRTAREKAPLNTKILSQLSDTLIQQARWDEAISILNEIIDNTTETLEKARALYNLGNVYTEIKDWDNAQKALERSYKLNRLDEDALVALGDLYSRKGSGHKAIEFYKESLKINPDNLKLLNALAQTYLDLGLLAEAELSLKNLLDHPLKNEELVTNSYFKLGEISYKRKAYDTAVKYFERSAKSSSIEIQYNSFLYIADSLIESNGPSSIILEYVEKAIALKPRDLKARLLRVRALLNEGSISSQETAEEELTAMIETGEDPQLLSKALTFRGIIYYKQGLYAKALDDFNHAIELNPSNEKAFENRRITAEKLEHQG
ncbi:MAG: tetratricopeptide repeat protein [Spirochaetia bacterium]|nr:tetratricopeptide repeat protein [Spirochaetia bacterium]